MIKIGIDLSTTNTGIVVLNDKNELMLKYDLTFKTFSEKNIKENTDLIRNMVYHVFEAIGKNNLFMENKIVGIELANFQNPLLTTRFNMYAGMIIADFCEFSQQDFDFKWFNSNAWQYKVGCTNKDMRDLRKAKARQFAKEHCDKYTNSWSEDVCDAYCIAYFLEEIKTQEMQHNELAQAKKKKKELYKQHYRTTNMINTRLQKIAKLDKVKNAKQIERLEREIKELRDGK